MKRSYRNKKAFSLAELLVVVAIMAIIAAVGIVQYTNARRNLTVKANDSNAKLIFLAAQNQMLQMKAYGQWDALVGGNMVNGEPDPDYFGAKLIDKVPSDYEYYRAQYNGPAWGPMVSNGDMRVISYTAQNMDNFPELFEHILPLGTVEDVVRTQGKYIIEYNVRTATVYSVFYTESEGTPNYADESFAGAFYNTNPTDLDGKGRPTGDDTETSARDIRRDYRDAANQRCILGYFGGGMISGVDYSALAIPEVRIDNGEELVLYIKDTNSHTGTYSAPDPNPREISALTVTVSGKTKGTSGYNLTPVSYELTRLSAAGGASYCLMRNGQPAYLVRNFEETENYISYEIVLDSITPGENGQNLHFANNFCSINNGAPSAGSIIPGEDIEVTVTARPGTNSNKVTLPVSRTVETNSLFDSSTVNGTNGRISAVSVSQLRHLENISGDISAVRLTNSAFGSFSVNFLNSVSFNGEGDGLLPIEPKDYSNKTITKWNGDSTGYTSGSYVPVNVSGVKLEVNGNDRCVYNIAISEKGAGVAGLFGYVSGKGAQATISGLGIVSSRTTDGKESAKVRTVYSGNMSAMGAFVGSVSGDLTLDHCWSTVQIKAYDVHYGDFGGLAGYVGGNLQVSGSYVSGRTDNGSFSMLPKYANISVMSAGDAKGDISAGGLIGRCDGAKHIVFENSYCSADVALGLSDKHVKNTFNFGGLLGFTKGEVVVENSYFSGWMNIPALLEPHEEIVNYGGFVGNAGKVYSGHSFWITEFLSITNLPENPVNGNNGVHNYEAPSGDIGKEKTYPYDSRWYGAEYDYPDVTGLGHHWGDWCRKTLPEYSLYMVSGIGIDDVQKNDIPTGWGYEPIDYFGLRGVRFFNIPENEICDLEKIANIYYKNGFEGVEYKLSGTDVIEPYDPGNPAPLPEGLTAGAFYYQMGDSTATIEVNATRLTDCSLNEIADETNVFNYEGYSVNPVTNPYDDIITVRRFIACTPYDDVLNALEMDRSMTGMLVRESASGEFHEYAPNENYFLQEISSVTSAAPYEIAKDNHYGEMHYKVFAFAYYNHPSSLGNVLLFSSIAEENFGFTLTRAPVTFKYTTGTDSAPGGHWLLNNDDDDITRYVEYNSNLLYTAQSGTTTIIFDSDEGTYRLNLTPGAAASVPPVELTDYYGNAFAFGGWKMGANMVYSISGGIPDQSTSNPYAVYNQYDESHIWTPTNLSVNNLYPFWALRTMIEELNPDGGYWEP